MCRAGVSLWPRPSPSWTPVAGRVLREALTGPLSGHQVMLMVDDGVQRSLSLDLLLTGLTSPTVLLHTTTHNTDNHFTTQQLPTAQDVLVMVGTGSPWLLWSPPGWLSPRAVLVLVAAQTCSARKHFQSPLLQNTPSVALLCLNHKPQTPEYSTYSVMTHFPLSANPEPVSLGTWHPDTFTTFEDLFPDQFQDFGGTGVSVISLLSQSVSQEPRVWVSRGLLGLWLLATWVLRVSYTSNLMAFLTVPSLPPPLDTLEQLADADLRLCMLDYGEFVPEALAMSTHPILARLGAKLDLVPIIDGILYEGQEGCVELVLAGTHAHVETYSYVRLLYRDLGHGGQVYPLNEQLYLGNLAYFFTKNTPWKYKFDIGMRRLVEAGLVWHWYTDFMQDKAKVRESRLPVLSLSHLQGPFLLLVVGGGLATITLLAERLLQPNTTSP
ncbi:hypothetical protein Pmani_006029 [Petrolisthes manimaculis]|uniref:Ionotropic glutamate receptor C-terminal domain-containing protein n=1 Tax=Petrolisthes manimaculis TaxID=1843537 RepID=A0AAE1QBH8_9EUCA|nr:hypothetical protein Pmani_006029 [Petrolisthes manimaculis]